MSNTGVIGRNNNLLCSKHRKAGWGEAYARARRCKECIRRLERAEKEAAGIARSAEKKQ